MMEDGDKIPDDMIEGIAQFSRQASTLVNTVFQNANKKRRPKLIYHYTNDAGLMGIIEKGEFWCTHISYLNDPTEIHHGIAPALKRIRAASATKGGEFTLFAKPLLKALGDNLHHLAQFFICCFSRRADDLGQWRAYGDSGRGYAIGFETELLEKAFNDRPGGHSHSFLMEYSEQDFRELQHQITDMGLSLVPAPHGRDLSGKAIGNYMGCLAHVLAENVIAAALPFKHPAYENEEELRFLEMYAAGTGLDLVQHRSRGNRRVPYVVVDWRKVSPEAIKRIVIGPAAEPDRARIFAKECMSAADAPSGVKIIRSKIPYRA
jgi:hypothetical protein